MSTKVTYTFEVVDFDEDELDKPFISEEIRNAKPNGYVKVSPKGTPLPWRELGILNPFVVYRIEDKNSYTVFWK